MNKINYFLKNIKQNVALLLIIVAVFFYILSLFNIENSLGRFKLNRIESRLINKIEKMDILADSLLNTSPETWTESTNIADDITIYKYSSGALVFWHNTFPTDSDTYSPAFDNSHILFDGTNNVLKLSQLNSITDTESYVNIGSGWYIAKSYSKGDETVIAAIFIKKEYIHENHALVNNVNTKLLPSYTTTYPVNQGIRNIISSKDGEALFSVVIENNMQKKNSNIFLTGVFIILFFLSLIVYHYKNRSFKSLVLSNLGVILLHFFANFIYSKPNNHLNIFSPTSFADNFSFDSLGDFITTNATICYFIVSMYIIRLLLYRVYIRRNKLVRYLAKASLLVTILTLISYIHYCVYSISVNSNITLLLFDIKHVGVYALYVYLSIIFIFYSLYLTMVFLLSLLRKTKRFKLFRYKYIITYSMISAIYLSTIIGIFNYQNEISKSRIWSDQITARRDIEMEFFLLKNTDKLNNDRLIKMFIAEDDCEEHIYNRLLDLFSNTVIDNYSIDITVCKKNPKKYMPRALFSLESECKDFFEQNITNKNGQKLNEYSDFYFINTKDGNTSYIGALEITTTNDKYTLYIEFSKSVSKAYKMFLPGRASGNQNDKFTLPNKFSYAIYTDGTLTYSQGEFNYPINDLSKLVEYTLYSRPKSTIHYKCEIDDSTLVIISRPKYPFFSYFISSSYISIVLGGILIFGTRTLRRKYSFSSYKKSFKNRITALITLSLISSFILIAIISYVFSTSFFESNMKNQVNERISGLQVIITESYNSLSAVSDSLAYETTLETLNFISINSSADLNIYDVNGSLVHSTRPDLFEKYVIGTRISPEPYKDLISKSHTIVIAKEQIADISYFSGYATIYDQGGNLIAIIHHPLFLDNSAYYESTSRMIAILTNFYLIIILIAIFLSYLTSNSIIKPLSRISEKLKSLNTLKRFEHIKYTRNDELGNVVKAYNAMVGDLKANTKKLAQSERELAWKEMARQIAHEIKNPLTPMKLSIQHLSKMKEQNRPEWQDKFDSLSVTLLEQIDILSNTANQFSDFAKYYEENNSITDLIVISNEQITLFDNRENISFIVNTTLPQALIIAKKTLITRVFVNLITNAIQAVESLDKAIIRLSIKLEGNHYIVNVEDNGEGIHPDLINMIFKPYFTTKSKGTGLGIAICKSIIDEHKGEISYSPSKELGGANFTIKLPKY